MTGPLLVTGAAGFVGFHPSPMRLLDRVIDLATIDHERIAQPAPFRSEKSGLR